MSDSDFQTKILLYLPGRVAKAIYNAGAVPEGGKDVALFEVAYFMIFYALSLFIMFHKVAAPWTWFHHDWNPAGLLFKPSTMSVVLTQA